MRDKDKAMKSFAAYQAHRTGLIGLVNIIDEEIGMDVVSKVIILNRIDNEKNKSIFSLDWTPIE